MSNLEDNTNLSLLKANDVAVRLNISRSLAYQLMQAGKIPTVRINSLVRVRPDDLEEYIQSNITVRICNPEPPKNY